MHRSSNGKYRGTSGTLTLGNRALSFTRVDGLISKRECIVISIPTEAIRNITVEGMIKKKLALLVDNTKVPGIPRHEFEVPDPYGWMNDIRAEMASASEERMALRQPHNQTQNPVYTKEVIKEIVRIPCGYCSALNDIIEKKCSSCGADVGRN